MYRPQFQSGIEKCEACAAACDECVSAMLAQSELADRARCIRLATDCAQACRTAAGFMARGSDFSGEVCLACEEICNRCSRECETHPEEHCRQCAKACQLCAAECQRMLASLKHGAAKKPTGGPYAG